MVSKNSKSKTNSKAKRKTKKKVSIDSLSKSPTLLSLDTDIEDVNDEQLALLSSMKKQSIEGIALVDLDGNIHYINQAFAKMHGYEPKKLMGKNLSIFHNKEQLKSVGEANKTLKKTGIFVGEIWHKHRDGTIFPTLMHNSLLRDENGLPIGMIGTIRDITQQKIMEDALRESETRFRQLINNAGNPIILYDLNNRVLFINNTCADNFGQKPENIIGKSIQEILPDFAEEITKRNKAIVKSGKGLGVEDFIKSPTITRWFTTNLQPAKDADGNIYGVLVISQDITKLKTSEKKLKKASEELKIKHDALQEKNVALNQVLSHIEDNRRDSLLNIQKEYKISILPLIKKLKGKLKNSQSKDIEALEISLKAIFAQDEDSFKINYGTLSNRESQISMLIKKGLSSKEISSKLNISIPTVFKHREQIRKKLELTNKSIGLATYLRSYK